MIARIWRCFASSENADHYLKHFHEAVVSELKEIDGYRGAYVLRRDVSDEVEITVMTLWESMEAIRRFAGAAVEIAVVAPAAQALLRDYDTTVQHHEVVVSPE